MGFFALAGLDVVVRFWSAQAESGWRAAIAGDAWEGRATIAVEPDPIPTGTEIVIAVPGSWERTLANEIGAAALYLPLPVTLDGEPLRREAFLADEIHVEAWRGCRIGVFAGGAR